MLIKLIKIAPTLLVVSVSAAVVWPFIDRFKGPRQKTTTEAGTSVVATAKPANADPRMTRDPFHEFATLLAAAAPVTKPTAPAKEESADTKVEEVQQLIQSMSLTGTMVQGHTELAIIDGKIYGKGDWIKGGDDQPTALRVKSVKVEKVELVAYGKTFELVYPATLVSAVPEEPAPSETTSGGLQALLAQPGGELALLRTLLASQSGGMSAMFNPEILQQLQAGGIGNSAAAPTPAGKAARVKATGAVPAGGDPALYADAKAQAAPKGKPAKAAGNAPAGGDPALYADPNMNKKPSTKSGASSKNSKTPAGGDPALYGGDTKKRGRSKR